MTRHDWETPGTEAPSISLELCQLLKEAGFSQDQFPQMTWRRTGRALVESWVTGWCQYAANQDPKEAFTSGFGKVEWIACPPYISGDPERPGIFEWFESRGWEFNYLSWHRHIDNKGVINTSWTAVLPKHLTFDNPHDLAMAVAKEMMK